MFGNVLVLEREDVNIVYNEFIVYSLEFNGSGW